METKAAETIRQGMDLPESKHPTEGLEKDTNDILYLIRPSPHGRMRQSPPKSTCATL